MKTKKNTKKEIKHKHKWVSDAGDTLHDVGYPGWKNPGLKFCPGCGAVEKEVK